VPDSHPSLETLARWLAGRLEHDEVLAEIAPHLFDRCSECQAKHDEIQRLLQEVGHWDEEIAVIESRQAPELFAWLGEHPFEEQLELVEEREDFQAWGLCNLLVRRSFEAVFENPEQATDLAELAVRVTHHLGEVYDPNWVLDLRARAYAHLANAQRVLGELRSAEAAFRNAERYLSQSTSGNSLILAELLDLKSSLRRAQRRLGESLMLADQALHRYRENHEHRGIAKMLLFKVTVLRELGDLEQAIDLLERSGSEIDADSEPRLYAYARFNLLGCLTQAERHEEAEQLLPEVRARFRSAAKPLDLVRLRWAEASISTGLGRFDEAEAGFRAVQLEFLDRRMGYDAALVSLDLAVLYAQRGATQELKRLAAEVMPAFESREVHREAMAALIMFQNACEEERLTVKLARHLAAFLQRERKTRAE
jgi:tetratricopeptide (TPR) repeat protein